MRRISSHGACLLDPAELTRTRGGAQVRAAHHVVGAVGAGLPAGLKKKGANENSQIPLETTLRV